MMDLDAIRARDARGDFGPEDALQACIDRRDLLAEVDRLRALVWEQEAWSSTGKLLERARIRAAVEKIVVVVDSGDQAIDAIADMATERFRKIVLADIDGGE